MPEILPIFHDQKWLERRFKQTGQGLGQSKFFLIRLKTTFFFFLIQRAKQFGLLNISIVCIISASRWKTVMSGLLRFSLKDLVGETVKWTVIAVAHTTVSQEEIFKASRYVPKLHNTSFIHSFANFTQYLLDEEQNGRFWEVPKDQGFYTCHR